MAVGAGAAPDIIYARGVIIADPSPDIDSFNHKDCSLILFKIGFFGDLGCRKKLRTTLRATISWLRGSKTLMKTSCDFLSNGMRYSVASKTQSLMASTEMDYSMFFAMKPYNMRVAMWKPKVLTYAMAATR
jgi:hypothetical protein